MWKLSIGITPRKAREYSVRVCAMWVCYERPVSLSDSVLNHFGVSSYTSLRACGSRLLCCPLLSWIKGSSVVPQMRNIYTMHKLPTLVYVLQVGRRLPVPQCSVKLLSMLIGFCTCKVRNILTLISLFSVCRWLMELQVSTVLPLSFQQVGFYFCLELTGVINRSMFWRANARASDEAAWGAEVLSSAPLAPASPFACGSRVNSRDSPKWRACSQAFLKHSYIRLALVLSKQ